MKNAKKLASGLLLVTFGILTASSLSVQARMEPSEKEKQGKYAELAKRTSSEAISDVINKSLIEFYPWGKLDLDLNQCNSDSRIALHGCILGLHVAFNKIRMEIPYNNDHYVEYSVENLLELLKEINRDSGWLMWSSESATKSLDTKEGCEKYRKFKLKVMDFHKDLKALAKHLRENYNM